MESDTCIFKRQNYFTMANNNRYRGSNYPNYSNREDDRDRYSRKDYAQYEGDYENSNNNNRRWRRYDEDWDDYNNRVSNYGNRNYGNGYGTSQYHRDWWDKTKDEVSSWFGDDEAERRRRMDKAVSHRGRGPKGYTRSDERIREDVNDRLSDDAYLDASEIEVSVSDGEVTLIGTVENRIDKRRAEDLADDISGVKNVQNQLRVKQTTTTIANGLKNEYQG